MSQEQQNGSKRNHNNNRNRNRNGNRNGNRNYNKNRNQGGPRKKYTPKPLKLTLWQKILKAIGLFDEQKARKKQQLANKSNQQTNSAKSTSNTRVAKPKKAPEKIPVASPRLYVGNLSYDASETDIEELFKGIGNVKKIEIIYNRHTHRSKGYGFVQMHNIDDAKRAVEVLHDQPFMGRNLIVNGSKARNENDPSADNDGAAA